MVPAHETEPWAEAAYATSATQAEAKEKNLILDDVNNEFQSSFVVTVVPKSTKTSDNEAPSYTATQKAI